VFGERDTPQTFQAQETIARRPVQRDASTESAPAAATLAR
jgi:hypothetical protein